MTRKLRPYDVPSRQKRRLIPSTPDSAAALYLAVSVLWLVVATGIGVLAAGERLFPDLLKFTFSVPVGAGISVDISRATVDPAFLDALVYGWLTNAAFAAIFFITPRISGARLMSDTLANLGLGAWNVAIAAGIALLYVKGASSAGSLAEFPLPVKLLALLGLLTVNGVFWRTVLPTRIIGYISLLYFGIGLLAVLGLFTLATVPNVISLGDVNNQLLWAFTARGIATYWVLGATLGALYYVIPRVTRNPLYSGGLALLAFVGWLAFAGLSAIGGLVDPSVPYVITTLGQAGTLLLLAPTFLAVANLLATMRGRWSLLLSAGPIQLAVASVAMVAGAALLESVGALRSVQRLTTGTDWGLGVEVVSLLGAATLAFYAIADHAAPRILHRAWVGSLLTQAELWATFGGATVAGLAMIAGGLAQGSLLAEGGTPDQLNATLFSFRLVAAAGMGLAALGGVALLVNLFILYTEGEPLSSPMPQPAPPSQGTAQGAAATAAGR
jgi:cbb3-type cytochrome oxidase subunit 1